MKKNLKIILILSILFFLYIFICAYSYVSAVSSNLSNSVFRLHVIANSDSEEDQNLKYIVRDSLIEYMNNLCENCTSKEEVIAISQEHISDFKNIAENTILENGFSYTVNVEIGNFEFPTKTYGDISFPAGYYDALKVEIGESKGQNWWCVMFPPLCFINPTTGVVSDESKEILQENLAQEEYEIISDTESSDITFKFKIIEFFEKTGLITAKTSCK
jgi:stage II sporulation protein R